MSNVIHIFGDYYLRSDKYQWVISTKKPDTINPKTKEVQLNWANVGFYTSPAHAIQKLYMLLLKDLDCTTLAELKDEAKKIWEPLQDILEETKALDTIKRPKGDGKIPAPKIV